MLPRHPKFAVAFAMIAGMLAWQGAAADGMAARIVWWWTAAAFGAVGAAYWRGDPRVFGKRADGTRHAAAALALVPYFAFSAAVFALATAVSRAPRHAEIAPGIQLGRRLSAREAQRERFAAVLDLAPELAAAPALRNADRYLSMPVLDGTAPTLEQLRAAAEWIAASVRLGPIYIHCANGVGRSATTAAAYLIAADDSIAPEEAERRLRAARPAVWLNAAQFAQLSTFHAERRVSMPAAEAP